MGKRLISVTLLLMLVFLLTANIGVERETHQLKQLQKHRELFECSKAFYRNSYGSQTRSFKVSEVTIQFAGWEQPTEWINEEQIIHTYNADGSLNTIAWAYWFEPDNDWIPPIEKATVHWYSDGLINKIVFHSYYYDTEEWVDTAIYTHHYNELNQIESIVIEMYDYYDEEFIEIGIISFEYNVNDILKTIYFTWIYDELTERGEETRVTFTYDENGRIVSSLDEEYIDQQWINIHKSTIQYHHSDNSSYQNVQDFINSFSLFHIMSFNDAAFPFGKPALETYWEWYENEWLLDDRYVYQYDNNNKLEHLEFQTYERQEGTWNNEERQSFTYDERQLLTEILIRFVDWDNPDEWNDYSRILYSYQQVSNTEDISLKPKTATISNYPNPFNPQTTIVFNLPVNRYINLNVFNSKGQIVKSLVNDYMSFGRHTIVWDGKDDKGVAMPSGTYFYRLDDESGSLSGKMLLLK